jgi:hypothetical protein
MPVGCPLHSMQTRSATARSYGSQLAFAPKPVLPTGGLPRGNCSTIGHQAADACRRMVLKTPIESAVADDIGVPNVSLTASSAGACLLWQIKFATISTENPSLN